MDRACNTNGTSEKCIQVLVGKLGRRKPLEITKRRWEYNILKLISEKWDRVVWTGLI
jgi:hypothetical protein